MPPTKIYFPHPLLKQNALLRFEMLPSPLVVKLPLRPWDVDLGSPCESSHPSAQGPLANGAVSARDGGEQAGWTGSSAVSGG
jgi:hypothetical protein